MPSAVLVAEPESETREYLGRQLRDDGFDVLDAARRSEALELVERIRPDVVLLAELDLCLRLRRGEPGRTLGPQRAGDRARADAPIRSSACARSTAAPTTSWGGRSRTRSCSRASARSSAARRPRRPRCSSRATSSSTAGRAACRVRDTIVPVSAKEFELLAWLAAEPYRVWTKEELLRSVWGFRALGRTRTLESHASRIRKKLRVTEDDCFIVNVWGVGYRLLE